MTEKEIHGTDAKANLITLLAVQAPAKPGARPAAPTWCDLQGRPAAMLSGNRFRLSDGTIIWTHPASLKENLNA